MPSPEPSRHGTAPGSEAPATSTFSAPSARSAPSTATPTRAIGCSARYSPTKRGSPGAGTPRSGRPSTVSRVTQSEPSAMAPDAKPPVASTNQRAW